VATRRCDEWFMSKHINVNPDHYKVRGRARPGDDIVRDQRAGLEKGRRVRQESPRIPNQERSSGRRQRSGRRSR
jgi:hypothetical protein